MQAVMARGERDAGANLFTGGSILEPVFAGVAACDDDDLSANAGQVERLSSGVIFIFSPGSRVKK